MKENSAKGVSGAKIKKPTSRNGSYNRSSRGSNNTSNQHLSEPRMVVNHHKLIDQSQKKTNQDDILNNSKSLPGFENKNLLTKGKFYQNNSNSDSKYENLNYSPVK